MCVMEAGGVIDGFRFTLPIRKSKEKNVKNALFEPKQNDKDHLPGTTTSPLCPELLLLPKEPSCLLEAPQLAQKVCDTSMAV